jgi:predicted DNA-binding transcriptional regulator AlpA
MELMTVTDLAAFLKCSKRSVYECTRKRGQTSHDIPLPVLRLPCGMRFLRSDVEEWIRRSADASKVQ